MLKVRVGIAEYSQQDDHEVRQRHHGWGTELVVCSYHAESCGRDHTC